MKKIHTILFCSCAVLMYSCVKKKDPTIETPKCVYTSSDKLSTLSQKWSNTFTQIDTYNSAGTTKTTSYIYPLGYFQLNGDNSYNVFSDNVPLSGKWTINTNCQLVLDSTNISLKRNFDVVKLTPDSLVITRKQNNIIYTQHYKTFNCPTSAELQYRWDNGIIRTDYYIGSTTTIGASYNSLTAGYFMLNADASYNIVSGSDVRSGKWIIQPSGCKLVLDFNTVNERAFDLLKLSTDSLVIWRKDASINGAYTQHYKKH